MSLRAAQGSQCGYFKRALWKHLVCAGSRSFVFVYVYVLRLPLLTNLSHC